MFVSNLFQFIMRLVLRSAMIKSPKEHQLFLNTYQTSQVMEIAENYLNSSTSGL